MLIKLVQVLAITYIIVQQIFDPGDTILEELNFREEKNCSEFPKYGPK